jgi:fibronectin-binding autotransporter adhesin
MAGSVAAACIAAVGPSGAWASAIRASCAGTSFTWTGLGDGASWSNAKNWNPNGTPGGCSADSVTIPVEANITGVPPVELMDFIVTSGAGSDGTLEGGPVTVSRDFEWDGSTLAATINLPAGSHGTVAGPGNFKGLGGGGLGKPGRLNVSGTLTLDNLSGTATGTLRLGAGISQGVIDVQRRGVLKSVGQDNLGGASCCAGQNNPTLINTGQIQVLSGRVDTEAIVASDVGRVDIAARSLFDVDGPISLSNKSSYSGPGRMLLASFPNSVNGTISIGKGFALELGAQACLDGTATITGGGTFDFSGGYLPARLTIARGTAMDVTGPGFKDMSTFACGTSPGNIVVAGQMVVDQGTLGLGRGLGSLSTTRTGVLSIAPGATITQGKGISNAGLLQIAPRPRGVKPGTPATVALVPLHNSGTIAVGTGQALLLDDVDLTSSGDVSAARGVITVNGSYRQLRSGTLSVLVAGLSAGSGFGQVSVAGAVSLSGTLRMTVARHFVVRRGETFLVLRYSSRTGTFSRLSGKPPYGVRYARSGVSVIFQ